MSEAFGQLPLYFIENRGQLDAQVAYYVEGRDQTLHFTTRGVTFAGADATYSLDFVGANPHAKPVGQALTQATAGYFAGARAEWQTRLKTYAAVAYRNLWPGVDVVYSGQASRMNNRFAINPGGDPQRIKLAYRGASALKLNHAGQLEVFTPHGRLLHDKPQAYQEVNGQRIPVAVEYKLDHGSAGYGFRMGKYDHGLPLMIEPAMLVYAGLLGGAGDDAGEGIAVDAEGNVYITGTIGAAKAQRPATSGLGQRFNPERANLFVAKFNGESGELIYLNHLGGVGEEAAQAIAVDAGGNLYVTGQTASANFPVTRAAQPAFGGETDAFVAKFNAAGSALVYSTYLGGAQAETVRSMAVDVRGNVYLAGTTQGGLPATEGAFRNFFSGGQHDVFVAKLNTAAEAVADSLGYCTYLGGSDDDLGFGIAVDRNGHAYVVGQTRSFDFPIANALQPTFGGVADGFVAKLDADGSTLEYSTYFGGTGADECRGITVDAIGNACVAGKTASPDLQLVNPLQAALRGVADAFEFRLDRLGSALLYSTYLGGSGDDEARGIALDAAGNTYLTGRTDSPDFPTENALQTSFGGGRSDAFVAQLKASGAQLGYATYLGGKEDDAGNAIAVDASGNAYITGATASPDFPRVNSFQSSFGGGTDVFVAKLASQSAEAMALTCTGTKDWIAGNGTWQTAANWSGGTLPASTDDVCIPAGVIVTLSSGTHTINSLGSNGNLVFSAGSLAVAGGFNSDGAVTINGGTLTLNAASTINNTFTISSGTLAGTGGLTIAGLITWSGGTMSGTGVTDANGGMSISGGGNTLSTRVVNNNGASSWTGGSLNFSNGAVFNNLAAGTLDVQSNQSVNNAGGTQPTFNNAGLFRKLASAGTTTINTTFNNTGTVDVQTGTLSLNNGGTQDGSFTVAAGTTLDLSGKAYTINASASISGAGSASFFGLSGGGPTAIINIAGTYNITGSTSQTNGTVNFNGPIINLGASLACNGGTANINSAPATSPSTLSVTGTANFNFSGTLAVTTITLSGTIGGSANLNVSGLFTLNNGTMNGTGATNLLTGATLNANGGAINGRPFNNSGTFNLNGGITLNSSAVFTNQAGSLFDIKANVSLNNGGGSVFNNLGNVRKSSGTGSSEIAAAFNNAATGTVDAQVGTLSLSGGGTQDGPFTVSAGATLDFSRTHTLNATASITGAGNGSFFGFAGGTTINIASTYNIATSTRTNATVNFNGPIINLGTSFTCAGGTTNINSAPATLPSTLSVTGTTNFNFTGTVAVPTITLNVGTIGGSANLDVSGLFTWNNGGLSGSGATNLLTGATLNISTGGTINGRPFNNSGTVNLNGGITLSSSAVFTNQAGGVFDIKSNVGLSDGGGAVFNNFGNVRKSGGTGSSEISVSFNNAATGTVNTQVGTLSLSGGGTQNGPFTVSAGATLDFSRTHTINASASITGAGSGSFFGFGGGTTINIASTYNIAASTSQSNGTVNFNGPITNLGTSLNCNGGTTNLNSAPATSPTTLSVNRSAANLNFSGTLAVTNVTLGDTVGNLGTINGAANLSVSGLFTWNAGVMGGSGATNLLAGGTLNIIGVSGMSNSRTINNSGAANGNGGTFSISNGAIFNNLPSATFDAKDSFSIGNGGGAAPAFNNSGVFRRSSSAGTASVNIAFNNTGAVDAQLGTLQFTGGFTQTAGATTLSGGNISSTTTLNLQGGSLAGAGTIAANVSNSGGTVSPSKISAPAGPTGILNIAGNYTQTAAGAFSVDLGGTGAGTQFDQLNVSGTATLNGTFNVTTLTGFVPNGGDAFKVLGYASRGGSFATINYLNMPPFRVYQANYNPADLTLVTQVIPVADLSLTKSDAPDPAPVGSNLIYTLNVANSGPDPATNVSVIDSLPPGVTFVSASASQGACSGTSTVTCNLGTINNGGAATVAIIVQPALASAGASISNTASVSATEIDSNTANNTASATTTVIHSANLALTMTDAPDPVFAGDDLSYTLVVTNNGPSNATGVTLTDTLPAGTFVSASAGCSPSFSTVTCNLGALASAASVTVTIVVRPTGSGTINNSASVTSDVFDPNTANNAASQSTMLSPKADLAITKTDSPDPALVGGNLTYTIRVTNNGPSPATAVNVADTLPAGVNFVSASSDQGTCSGTSVITCNLGMLSIGQVVTVTIVVTPIAAAVPAISNTASAASDTFDPNTANNSATQTTTINAVTDLAISLSDAPDPVLVGDALTYTSVVTNGGPADATGVTVTDNLPPTVTFVSASSNAGSCAHASGTVTCGVGALSNGASATVTIVVTPDAAAAGTLANTISVNGAETDPSGANNSASASTTVNPKTDLWITKNDLPDPVFVGSPLTYEIAATNGGPSPATGVIVSDQLPAAVVFDVASFTVGATGGSCAYNGETGSVTCNIGNLASGQTANVTLVVIPQASAVPSITNTVTVTGNQTDPNPSNNSATADTTVLPKANLSITKSDSSDPVTIFNPLTYTIAVSNGGPSPATGIVVTDQLPPSVSFVSASPGCSQFGGGVTCNAGSLASGATVTATIVVTPTAGGTISNTASATANEFDPDTTNNTATQSTVVTAEANLAIAKTASPNPVVTGSEVTYTIAVTNNGPGLATSTVVTDNLPASTTFVSCAATGGGVCGGSGNNRTVALGSIASGVSATITLVARVHNSVCNNTAIGNTATVNSATPDPDVSNNAATTQSPVSNPPPVATLTGPPTGSVYAVNTPVNFSGTFTDVGGGTHTAVWTFDNLSQTGLVNETTGAVTGSYTFTTAGVYNVTLTVMDDCGGAGSASTIDDLDLLIVIYDPGAGFVTGGGWINSPAGAYVGNPTLTGKANFGFVSKYHNGATIPTGNTEFQFKAAGLNFHSAGYEWLVVAGRKAQYKGFGTINGSGNYRFMLTAIDGQQPGGGGQDKFRIRIWSDGGGLVYDNQMNDPDSNDPTTVLGGGSIVIHR